MHSNPNSNVTSIDPLARRRAAAEERVASALDRIQEAQALIDEAGQELCGVLGMLREWERLGPLYDSVKASWYAVSNRSAELRSKGRLLLDHEPSVPSDVLGESLKGALPVSERR